MDGRLHAIDQAEMRALVLDAWAMVVPRKVVGAYLENTPRVARIAVSRVTSQF